MKKILFYFLLLSSLCVQAQGTQNEVQQVIDPGAGYQPALTGFSNVAAAFGTVQLVPTATKSLRLQRGTTTVQTDLYFNKMLTAIGAGLSFTYRADPYQLRQFANGDRAYVVMWYNQQTDGASGNATPATLAKTPYAVATEDGVAVRFEEYANGNVGQALNFTTSSITLNNSGFFCTYKASICSGQNFGAGFVKRTILGTSGGTYDLASNSASPDYDALYLGTASTTSLYLHGHNNAIAIESGASNAVVESNGSTATLTARAGTETSWTIGNNNANTAPFTGDIYTFVIFNTALTSANVTALKTSLKGVNGLVLSAKYNVIIAGDSESAGKGTSWNQNWNQLLQARRKDIWITNMAVDGAAVSTTGATPLLTRFNDVDRQVIGGMTNILVVWANTNDYANSARTPAQIYTDDTTYAHARKTAGFNKIIWVTMLARGSTTQNETDRTTINNNVINDVTGYIDYVFDIGSDPRLQFSNAVSGNAEKDENYFITDGIHMTIDGYRIVAQGVDNAIKHF